MLDLYSTRANHPNITIISDDDDLPSETHKRVVSIRKQQASNTPTKPCPGYKLHFPPGQQAHTSYPFALHTVLPLPWDYSGHCDGFFLVSHSCSSVVEVNGRCKRCNDLDKNEYLQKIVTRFMKGIHENTTLIFHGIGGLIDIVHWKTHTIDQLRLHHLNDFQKLVGREGTLDIYKQFLLAISSLRIPHVGHVLRVGFRRGTGICPMLELIKKAAEGSFHPKGFNEEEELQALLFLRLGGAQVADAAHRIFGTPAVSTIRRHTIIPQIIASPSFLTSHEIGSNIAASFKPLCDILGASMETMLHAVIMFDEISIERHPRWDDKTNKILGVCREHGQDTSLEFTSEDDLQTLWEELQHEKIHLAHKVRVDACGPLFINDLM